IARLTWHAGRDSESYLAGADRLGRFCDSGRRKCGAARRRPPRKADRTRPELGTLAERQLDRAEGDGAVGEGHRERHRVAEDRAAETGGVEDPSVHRVRRDILLPWQVEAAVGVCDDRLMHVAVGAADVDMGAGVVGDEPGSVATPRAGDLAG